MTEPVSHALLSLLAAIATPVTIQDVDGNPVISACEENSLDSSTQLSSGTQECCGIVVAGQTLGWVTGSTGATAIAAFLSLVGDLQHQLDDLHTQLDAMKGTRPVAEISEDDYFQQLQRRTKPFKPIKPLPKDSG
jgi:hypothetical protein